ncbi:MAG TPA: histidine phosphatase family protein [Acidimicrobiia bacterium]|nr:histidine phosphatase family protein [Acidimicrobiia bacterium]
MRTVLVVRHARAKGNTEHRFIGQQDVPLDEIGRLQAAALTRRLLTLPITRIVSSDLARSLDTVQGLTRALGIDVEPDRRLREIDNGEWSGLLPTQIEEQWPSLWSAYVRGEDVDRPGGESWHIVRERATRAIAEHAGTQSSDGILLIATHGGPALSAAMWAAGLAPGGNIFRRGLGAVGNTGITTIELTGPSLSAPRLAGFNDLGHLPPGLAPAIRTEDRLPYQPVTE